MVDPKVSDEQIVMDMEGMMDNITCQTAKEALDGAHAVTIMTEWDEFKMYDWKEIYEVMQKPAFVFDGRNILDPAPQGDRVHRVRAREPIDNSCNPPRACERRCGDIFFSSGTASFFVSRAAGTWTRARSCGKENARRPGEG